MDRVDAEVFAPGTSGMDIGGSSGALALYVVPGKLPPGWKFYLVADMIRPHETLSPVEYGLVRVFTGSIPSNLTFAIDRAKLASDQVTVRRVDPGGTDLFWLYPEIDSPTYADFPAPYDPVGQSGTAPFSIDFYLTPGYAWLPCGPFGEGICGQAFLDNARPWGVGHRAQTFGSAVFGPSGEAALVWRGTLYAGTGFPGLNLLEDPGYANAGSPGLSTVSYPQVWLYRGGRLLSHSTTGGVELAIPSATDWYTLRMAAVRPRGSTLFRSLTLTYTFPAHAEPGNDSYNPGVFWPRIVPSGLSGLNAARARTKTTVPFWFANQNGTAIVAYGVRVWASDNGGKTWAALRVGHRGSRWTVVVNNPGRAGYVSLRVRGTNADGISTEVTIINAYTVTAP